MEQHSYEQLRKQDQEMKVSIDFYETNIIFGIIRDIEIIVN